MRAPLVALGLFVPFGAAVCDLAAQPAPPAEAAAIEIPGDIFGFTSATDTGAVGDRGIGLENDLLFGARVGRYGVLTQKLEFGYAFAQNWSIAGSAFGAFHHIRTAAVPPDDVSAYRFDGVSIELRHRILERTATQPFALTLAAEPRFARVNGEGARADQVGIEAKFQIDAPVTDRLFWAMNANFATGGEQNEMTGRWSSSSGTAVSTALAYSLAGGSVFIGAEVRWLQAYDSTFFGRRTEYAVFVGPTLQATLAENVSFNMTLQPQIAGRVYDMPRDEGLDPFDRALFRAKVAVAF